MTAARYRSGKEAKSSETALGDDDDFCDNGDGVEDLSNTAGSLMMSVHGDAFCAILPSMYRKRTLQAYKTAESQNKLDYTFDEFGFKIEAQPSSSKPLSIPFTEDPQHRLRWIAHLEFSHNQVVEELTWDKIESSLPKSDKLYSMVSYGIPHSLRPYIWPRICGAISKRRQANFSYKELIKAANNEQLSVSRQIEKDLLRTLPNNVCFMTAKSPGIPALRRVLRAVAYLFPEIGYCQGMGVVVSILLLFLQEEEVFWMMCAIIEDILPGNYFSRSLIGLQADQKVLQTLVALHLPQLDKVLKEHDIELALISLHWFLTMFSSVTHIRVLLRIWDLLFYSGSVVLFQVALAMLKMYEAELKKCTNSAEVFNLLSDLPGRIDDANALLTVALELAPSLSESFIATSRKKHLACLLADQGVLVNPQTAEAAAGSLPKSHINRRKLKRSQSFVAQVFGAETTSLNRFHSVDFDDARLKNVRQTEILVDLKDAILKICRHFVSVDPGNYSRANLQPDYSLESHAKDHENFCLVHRNRHKRARALLDFERHDDDELGFRKNDIITIICEKDEHCWIGELNGLKGWFPAKFVELLDERSKCYSVGGDDAVTTIITDLVRGTFCQAVKEVFEHGIKRSHVLGGPCHPWLFIEEVANREVQKDFDSVYSRLVLCKTFRLDEDGKVLTPEELLYKAVQQVNTTHDAVHAQLDVKLRSLVCVGLNENLLHLWFELLCSCDDIVRRWYQRWSYIRSPGWIQIKCDLRLLAQFPFNLAIDWELPARPQPLCKPLKEGVRDMLVKHHLFSWDL